MTRRARRNPESPFVLQVQRRSWRGFAGLSDTRYVVWRKLATGGMSTLARLEITPDADRFDGRLLSRQEQLFFAFDAPKPVSLWGRRTPRGDVIYDGAGGLVGSARVWNTRAPRVVERYGAQIDELLSIDGQELRAGEYTLADFPYAGRR